MLKLVDSTRWCLQKLVLQLIFQRIWVHPSIKRHFWVELSRRCTRIYESTRVARVLDMNILVRQ